MEYDIDFISAQLEELSENNLIDLYNAHLEADNRPEEMIFENNPDFICDKFPHPWDALRAAHEGCYHFEDYWVYLDEYDQLCSFSNVYDAIDTEVLALWLTEYDNGEFAEEWGIKLIEEDCEE